jgi:MFS family permease
VFVDRFGTGIFSLVMMLLQFIALLSLGLADSIPVFLISLALFGITIGNLLMLQPLLIAEVYGQISYSRIYGLSNLLTTFGVALGPFLLGYIYSSDSSYVHAYVIASLAGLAGFIIYLTVKHLTDKSSQQKE